ncbi:unnamed protein product [Psylliodes chrysocephalus]|uniref:Uncharacterized protein n=1 Tax=Psylliodes chrysocephalus TaxID=3402493 RepID=A0A9P0G917_9CUCU|nr:unnamed protein product [Psylliodes chrysocephala]
MKEFESDSRIIRSLYFDVRKDKTLLQKNKNGRLYKKTVVEEHISLIEQPEYIYIGHITPTTGTEKSFGKAQLNFFDKNNLELDNLAAVGCNGTVVNTGSKKGVINISDGSAASIASAVLKDVGIITTEDPLTRADKKVSREQKKSRNTAMKEFESDSRIIRSLYFNVRKDKTLLQKNKNGRLYKKTVVEEHISLIEQPEYIYIGHVTPTTGTEKSFGKAQLNFFDKNNLELDNLAAVGCNCTVVNTGSKKGVIKYIEQSFIMVYLPTTRQPIAIKTFIP